MGQITYVYIHEHAMLKVEVHNSDIKGALSQSQLSWILKMRHVFSTFVCTECDNDLSTSSNCCNYHIWSIKNVPNSWCIFRPQDGDFGKGPNHNVSATELYF